MPPNRATAITETEELVAFERAGETADATYDDYHDEWLCNYQTEDVEKKARYDDRSMAVMWCMLKLGIIDEHPEVDQ